MKFQAVRVRSFRSITDSGWVDCERLTVFVGRNEAGKTALFKAIHKFKADTGENYDIDGEWPRGKLAEQNPTQVVCSIQFALSEQEQDELRAIPGVETVPERVEVSRTYAGHYSVAFPDDTIPSAPPKVIVTKQLDSLRVDPATVSPAFLAVLNECLEELELLMASDSKGETARNSKAFVARLIASRVAQGSEPQYSNEGAYVAQFEPRLAAALKALSALELPTVTAARLVESWLPTFIYLSDYSTFSGSALLDQVKARRDQKQLTEEDKTFLIVLELAGVDLDKEVERASKGKREYRVYGLHDASKRLTELVAKHITWRKYEIQLQADGTHFFTFVKDDTAPELIKLEERSRGMQWFLSFDLLFLHGTRSTFKDSVLLLDEPGLHLHPDAQKLLLERLENYAKSNTILYTTHLPFMIDLRHPERIRVAYDDATGTHITDKLTQSQPQAKLTLEAALGMSGAASYLVSKRNLVVEGVDDYWILSGLSNLFLRAGETSIPDDVLITAAGGAAEVAYISTFMVGQKLEVVALLDSDLAGEGARDSLVKRWLTKYGAGTAQVLMLGEAAGATNRPFSIEDVFPEDWYLERVKIAYRRDLTGAGLDTIELPKGGGSLVQRVERVFESRSLRFNKGTVAKLVRTDLAKAKDLTVLPEPTLAYGRKIVKAINDAFK